MNGKITKSVLSVVTALLVCFSVFAGVKVADANRNMPTADNSTQVQTQQKPETEQPQISAEPEEVVAEKTEDTVAVPVIKTQNTTAANSSTAAVNNSTKPDKGSASDKNHNNQNNNNSGSNQEPVIPDVAVTESIEGLVNSDSTLAQAVTMTSAEGVQATVPAGVKVENGTQQLVFTVTEKAGTDSNVKPEGTEKLDAYDIHIEGIAKDNTTPIAINLGEALAAGLNKGNLALYHVENGQTVAMTEVDSAADFSAHNQFAYNPENGEVSVAMTGFSEVALVSNTEEGWKGEFDYNWYDASKTEFTIANADQLAAFGAIVGGMAEGIERDSFDGKTVKLVNDINLGDAEAENDEDKIFYPIGYYYNGDSSAPSSTVYSFEGTFDGNGHKISNFYQNTWEIKGDYDGNYYKDAMGLFGYVVNGTVKNLTVDNFSSDGEFTPTGVIAAYAVNSTFENIAITKCNPRVYNTGNGGIIGVAGDTNDANDDHITLKNITVDNSNKISALWGSWDVACGGLVGMYRGNVDGSGNATGDTISFENCHVSAQIDVYNDVCANYQYYAYRYAGMIIGSVRHNTKNADGKVIPAMDGISASGCTVNYGDWNDYYYCEFEKNSLASYSEDYQFSRVPHSELNFIDSNGNGVVDAGERASVTGCKHDHTAEENHQAVYLPFHQLFTGYSWGVSSIGLKEYSGIVTDLGIEEGDQEESVVKFEKNTEKAKESYATETTIKVGDLFKEVDGLAESLAINKEAVMVSVSPNGENSTAGGTYTANTTDWTQGTLTFSGLGKATITITDYYFCTPTTINVEIVREPEVKFANKFTGDFLYRVGNAENSPVELNSLFAEDENKKFAIIDKSVEVIFETVAGNAGGTFTANTTKWTQGTIQFTGTGVVKVAITDNDYCTPTVITLEVVDAVNATTATNATANNVVLLNDIGSGFTVSGRYTVYGNGFTLNYTGNGQYLNNGLKQGIVTVSENGTLDNLRIVASIYPNAYMYYGYSALGDYVQGGPYSKEGDRTRYHYQLSAVAASGNATISNCYIYGGRNNIFVNTGDVTIRDSILECGTVANVQIQSNASHTITFEDVTTIQYQVNPTIGETSKVMLGAGVLVGPETNDNPKIVLNGEFKQYNWVTKEDANVVSDEAVEKIINGALDATAYNHTVNGKTASNLGIIYMNTAKAEIADSTKLPYKLGTISMNGISGQVYSLQNASAEQIFSDYANADKATENGIYQPQFKYSADLGGQHIAEGGDEHCYLEGDTIHVMFPSGDTKELDLAALVDIEKYNGQDLGLEITCKDENGNDVAVTNGKVSLSNAGEYTVTYTVTDTQFYDKNGNLVTNENQARTSKSITYSWDVTISVSLKDTAVPNAYFEFDASKQKMGYEVKSSIFSTSVYQYIPFLSGLKIYDYYGQESYLRFDGDEGFNKVAKIEVTNKFSGNDAKVVVILTDGGKIELQLLSRADSGGGSTYTGSIKTSNNIIYFVNDGTTSDKESTTTAAYWYVDYYKFIGNNGVEITSAQQTFTSTGSSASTPSGSFGTTIKYTVAYDANGGKCTQTTGYATSATAAVTLPTPTRSGYMFVGWYTAASGGTRVGGAGDSYTPSANITLYAQWGKPSTVTYNANGGSCGTASEKYTGTALTLPTPTRDGYWFTGWYDAAEGGNKIGDAGAGYQATGDVTLYAQWNSVYTVTYNANGGSVTPASAKYEGTALTLPMPIRDGYAFNGWYTAASDGTKVEGPYTPTADITLYAQWKDPVVVTYDATTNGGSCATTSQTYLGSTLTLPTPAARTGYTFLGWYTAASGGTKIGDAGASYTPNENITLYAQWQIDSYTIKVTTNNATVKVNGTTVNNNGTVSVQYGAQVTVEVEYSKDENRETTIEGVKYNTDNNKYTFTMPANDVTINATSSGCVTPDTLITLADGSQKQVQYLNPGEELLVWNLETGSYDTAAIVFVDSEVEEEYDVVKLGFSDGSEVKVIYEHGFFDLDLGRYVYINAANCGEYVGHRFVAQGDVDTNSWNVVTLDSAVVETQTTTAWSPVTFKHLCYYTDGVLSMPGGIDGLFNIFDVDTDTMAYDSEKMAADLETYGRFTFDDFAGLIPEIAYEAFNGEYLKVAIGKGLITWETIEGYANRYVPLIPSLVAEDLLADEDDIMVMSFEEPAAPAAEPSETEEPAQPADNGADDSDNGGDLGEEETPAEEIVEEPAEEPAETPTEEPAEENGEGAEI